MRFEESAREVFLKIYNNIVDELPWTVFVSYATRRESLREEILDKLERNIRYGTNFLIVHGLGKKNVEKIRDAVSEVQKQYPRIHVSIREVETRIYVRFELRD